MEGLLVTLHIVSIHHCHATVLFLFIITVHAVTALETTKFVCVAQDSTSNLYFLGLFFVLRKVNSFFSLFFLETRHSAACLQQLSGSSGAEHFCCLCELCNFPMPHAHTL